MANQVQRDREFKVSATSLYNTIADFESYKDFLPEVKTSSIVAGRGTPKVTVHFEIEVVKRFAYDLEFTLVPEKEISWRLVSSDFFKTNQGKWVLTPQGNHTQVRYELEVGVAFLVPGWIAKKLTESSLPQMFEKFESRAQGDE
ncbi:MAG: hypothetical protein EBQ85_02255 [Proteobacteria bacterium]|nr:hypothetical protein [Pseudomonadota bacterium]